MTGFSACQIPQKTARGVLRGERAAVADAYGILSRPVMGLAMRILQDRAQAEEVVQDTFVELLEKCTQIQARDAIKAWVRRVAVNHCLMRLRSPWHARRDASDDDISGVVDAPVSGC